MATSGKWKLVSEENVEAFIKATGGGEKEINDYAGFRKTTETYETYALNGECITATTEEGTKSTTVEIHFGKWCDLPEDEGISKIIVKELGKDQYAFAIENPRYKATGTRVFIGDDMVLTITVTGSGVTGTRRYTRVK